MSDGLIPVHEAALSLLSIVSDLKDRGPDSFVTSGARTLVQFDDSHVIEVSLRLVSVHSRIDPAASAEAGAS